MWLTDTLEASLRVVFEVSQLALHNRLDSSTRCRTFGLRSEVYVRLNL